MSEIYSQIQGKRTHEPSLTFESISLSPHLFKGVPTIKTEVEPKAEVFGIPVIEAAWMPEGMAMATTGCRCTIQDGMKPEHLNKHVTILDFRTDEQKRADAEKFKTGDYET